MTEIREIYKCNICGNVVEVVHAAAGTLVCCGQPMQMLSEKQEDAGSEKHVPVLERTETGFIISIGSVPHPMEENHFIEWIELIADGVVYRKRLKPGDNAVAKFCVDAEEVYARAYCNVHGLWASK